MKSFVSKLGRAHMQTRSFSSAYAFSSNEITSISQRNNFTDYTNATLQALRILRNNCRGNEEFLANALEANKYASPPDLTVEGHAYVRQSIGDQKKLVKATPKQINSATLITIAGKQTPSKGESLQTPFTLKARDASHIAKTTEQFLEKQSPEDMWALFPSPPLTWVPDLNPFQLEIDIATAHMEYAAGRTYSSTHSRLFTDNVLLPRFLSSSSPLSINAFTHSGGGKIFLMSIASLKERLIERGFSAEEAVRLIGEKISLTAVGLMPDIKGLRLHPGTSFHSVSVFDARTRPQLEEYQRVFGNQQVIRMLEKDGVVFLHVTPKTGQPVKDRIAVFGEIPLSLKSDFAHDPESYCKTIGQYPVLRTIYQKSLLGEKDTEYQEALNEFDRKSIAYEKLPLSEKGMSIDPYTGLRGWENTIVSNFAAQIVRDTEFKAQQGRGR